MVLVATAAGAAATAAAAVAAARLAPSLKLLVRSEHPEQEEEKPRKCKEAFALPASLDIPGSEGSTTADGSEPATQPPSPGGASCSLLSCPMHDALSFFLAADDLVRLSSGCSALRSELTVAAGETSRRLMVPVVELHVETAETVLERVSLAHIHTLRIKKRLPFDALAAAARKTGPHSLRTLEKLVIQGCILDAQDVKKVLAPLLAATRGLKLLNMEKCRITDATVQQLCSSGVIARVETLNLRFNEITDKGALALAACADTAQLKWINLKMNRVGDQGALALAKLLSSSTTMTLLNLRRQVPGLTDRAALGFAEMLTTNTSLQQLRLRRNRITDKGAAALAAAAGPRLRRLCAERMPWDEVRFELDLEENRIGEQGALECLRSAALVPSVARVELLLSGNKVTRESLSQAAAESGEALDAYDPRVCFVSKAEFDL